MHNNNNNNGKFNKTFFFDFLCFSVKFFYNKELRHHQNERSTLNVRWKNVIKGTETKSESAILFPQAIIDCTEHRVM